MTLIAADVGGTKTRLATGLPGAGCGIAHEAVFASGEFAGFDDLLQQFFHEARFRPSQHSTLTLALPGVIEGNAARLTNLPWHLHKEALRRRFQFAGVHFLNDFQASAAGIACLEKDDCVVLHAGRQRDRGVRLVTGAGTGLGLAWQMLDENGGCTCSTEGGHMDFAPCSETQLALLQYLRHQYDHVSFERVLSGPGLENIYAFLRQGSDRAGTTESAKNIIHLARQGEPLAREAVRLFTECYGAYVGNLALAFKPEAGIYITGGMAARLQSWMQSDAFRSSYLAKGRMTALVKHYRVTLVTNQRVGVLGALAEARRLAQGKLAQGEDNDG